MLALKLFLVASLFLAASSYQPAIRHNFTLGYRLPGDRLVSQEIVEVKSKLWQVVTLVRQFNATRFTRITKVEAIDRKTDGTGAFVTLIKGGPTYPNVTLRFKSQRNHGIHFIVNLYAR